MVRSVLGSWMVAIGVVVVAGAGEDPVRQLQQQAAESGRADWGHWGSDPARYSAWTSHSNRLVPVYTFGLQLDSLAGPHSPYRDPARLKQLYQRSPAETLNPEAEYFDQADLYRLQTQAISAGKKYIVLVMFDGMDWQTTLAAATYRTGQLNYDAGRGTGLLFQDYRGAVTDYGYFVCSPYASGVKVDVDAQTLVSPGDMFGGYNGLLGGARPWDQPADLEYLIAKSAACPHAYTDSAASATSVCAGVKTYNDAINVDPFGRPLRTLAHDLQQQGFAIGVVSSVPISHATPACSYAQNVHRDDYQDLTRDLLGRPSVSHPEPLPGVDVLIGAGWGETKDADPPQGQNFVPGNRYLVEADLQASDVDRGGQYVVAQRTSGQSGSDVLRAAAEKAVAGRHRLLGYFGARGGHLPYATADGDYEPTFDGARVDGALKAEQYSEADRHENPTLAEMTSAALTVLEDRGSGFWLMVEPGDVDWANHANNIDNAIGAVLSGDQAFRKIVEWVEARNAWEETAIIVTADHGHLLVLDRPEVFAQQ